MIMNEIKSFRFNYDGNKFTSFIKEEEFIKKEEMEV